MEVQILMLQRTRLGRQASVPGLEWHGWWRNYWQCQRLLSGPGVGGLADFKKPTQNELGRSGLSSTGDLVRWVTLRHAVTQHLFGSWTPLCVWTKSNGTSPTKTGSTLAGMPQVVSGAHGGCPFPSAQSWQLAAHSKQVCSSAFVFLCFSIFVMKVLCRMYLYLI